MLYKNINNPDLQSRFSILKGSTISLAVSALLISSTLISPANAATITINTPGTVIGGYSGGANSLLITDTGSVTWNDSWYAVPVDITTLGASETIINNGTMNSVLFSGDTGTAGSIFINNIGLVGTAAGSNITNNGTMTATTDAGAAYVVNIIGSVEGDITNSSTGIITANGVTGASGVGAIGIKVTGDTTGIITNDGTLNATATNGHARGIEVTGAPNGSIVNNGTINVDSLGDAFGILLGGADGAGSVTNNGTIIVNGGTSGNPVHQSYGFKTSKAITGGVTNTGTIKATINSEYDKQGYSLYMRFNEAFTNEASGKLYGNIAAYAGTGNVINKGLVSLPYNVNGRDGDGDTGGAANLANFTQNATGTLEIGLLTDGTTSTYSKFLVSNTATFADGSTIGVNVLAASTNVALLEGSTLDDVVTAGTLTLDGTLKVIDNSALLNFEYVEDGETIDLNVVKGSSILTSTTEGGGNKNDKKTATALQRIQDEVHPEMDQLFASLNTLGTDEEVAAAVASTTPQTTSAAVGAASQISNGIAGIVEQRQQANIGGGLNSGDEMFASQNAWVKAYGSKGKQDNLDGLNGFDVDTYGIGMGVDGEYKDNQNIGVAFFYTNAGVDVNNVSQSSDIDVFTTLVYGNVPVIDQKTNFLYQLGYAFQKTNSTRNLFNGQTAKADYTSKTASVDLKLMRDYSINDRLLLQPLISTTYRHFDNPEYSETGAGANSLNVNGFTSSEFLVGIGTLAHYKIDEKSKIIGSVKVDYDTKDDKTIVTSSYQGASGVTYDTEGIDNGRWQYEASIGYERDVKEGHNLNFAYNYQAIGSGFSNNVISARYMYSF